MTGRKRTPRSLPVGTDFNGQRFAGTYTVEGTHFEHQADRSSKQSAQIPLHFVLRHAFEGGRVLHGEAPCLPRRGEGLWLNSTGCRLQHLSEASYDRSAAVRLWEMSARMTGLAAD